jgi:uncharacterized oxidoreductase
MPLIPADQLKTIAIELFRAIGVAEDKVQVVANRLVEANLAGHDSHGVLRLPHYVRMIQGGAIQPDAEIEVVRQTPSSAVIDGRWGFGQVIATQAMKIAIAKAKENVVSSVNVYNCNHMGRLGDYAAMAAEANMIGLMFVNGHGADQGVAPWGGIARRLGTNPMACAIPTGRAYPMLLDITTSVVAGGKIRAYRNRGEPLPEGWIIGADGKPSANPATYLEDPKGALLPFGGIAGHKGYGLGLLVDILAGAMCEAGCSRPASPRLGNAFLIIVIDIERFTPIADFEAQVSQLIDFVKASPTALDFDEVLIPGEKSFRTRQERLANGIPLDDITWESLAATAKHVGIDVSSDAIR